MRLLLQLLMNGFVGAPIQNAQGDRFQLVLDVPDAQAVGQGGVNVQRLFGLAPLRGGRGGKDGAHVVQPVEDFDDADAQVVGHEAKQFAQGGVAQVFGGELGDGIAGGGFELGESFDQPGYFLAELGFDLSDGDAGIFDHVVE